LTGLNVNEVEQAIHQLSDVHSARIILDETTGEIDTIHVMATPQRSAKKVVRDIETLLLLRYQLRLDYRKISLVRGKPEDFRPLHRPRLRFTAAEERLLPGKRRVMVSLSDGSETYLGIAEGDEGSTESAMLAVDATVDALTRALPDIAIEQETLKVIPMPRDRVLLLALTVRDQAGEASLLGSVYERENVLSAAARVTLDAVNRRLFAM
jgi:hypothetical protein